MSLNQLKKYPLYYFEWVDAMAHVGSWISEDDAIEWLSEKEGLVIHVGFIIEETKDYILVASRIAEINEGEKSLGGLFKVPTKWVKKKIKIPISSF